MTAEAIPRLAIAGLGIEPGSARPKRYVYPVELEPEPDGSAVNSRFPDVPGALTWGDDEAEALSLAEDCLVTALYGYVRSWEAIPEPGPARGGR